MKISTIIAGVLLITSTSATADNIYLGQPEKDMLNNLTHVTNTDMVNLIKIWGKDKPQSNIKSTGLEFEKFKNDTIKKMRKYAIFANATFKFGITNNRVQTIVVMHGLVVVIVDLELFNTDASIAMIDAYKFEMTTCNGSAEITPSLMNDFEYKKFIVTCNENDKHARIEWFNDSGYTYIEQLLDFN